MATKNMLDKLLGGKVSGGLAGGLAGGALAGMLLTKGGRKGAKKLLKYGGIAALGGIAYKAYQNYRDGEPTQSAASATPALPSEAFDIADDDVEEKGVRPMLLVRAMITAAMADGHLDAAEQQRVFERIDTLDLSASEQAELLDELRNPLSQDQLVAQTNGTVEALEVYGVSLFALDQDDPAAQSYLAALQEKLKLPPVLVQSLAREADMQPPVA